MDLKKRYADLQAARAQYQAEAQASIDKQSRTIAQMQQQLQQTSEIARDTLAKCDGAIQLVKELIDEEPPAVAPSGGQVATMPAGDTGAEKLAKALAAEGYPTEPADPADA